MFRYGFCQFNTIPHTNDIRIFRWTPKYFIPYKTTDQVSFHIQFFCGTGDFL